VSDEEQLEIAPADVVPAKKAVAKKAAAPAKKAVAKKAAAVESAATEAAPGAAGTDESARSASSAPATKVAPPPPGRPRLKERYLSEYRPQLQQELGLVNVMQVPGLEKIVVNMGVGRATQQQSLIEGAQRDLQVITGQKPIVTRAKKSIAGFKLREGQAIGVKVTLRGDRAWEFFDRLVSLAIPRIRDFRGLSPRSFDGRGNYTFGVVEQLIFPEVDYDRIDTIRGMDITIVTTAHTDEHGRALLRAAANPEIQGPGLHPVPTMRSAEGRLPQVRAVPYLPAHDGARRGDPGRDEVELVSEATS
jgi:large subunit ribosomal protein L5